MNDRLSSSDMSSLLAERGPIHVHVGGTILVEGQAPDFDEFVAHVEKRLNLVPRFRQKVTETPLNLTNPVWVDDPRFDVRRHVRYAALPRPASLAQLREYAGWVMSDPLDMEHPLWELYMVERVEGGRHAFISKTHHALVDGISAVDVGMLVLDPSPKPMKVDVPAEPWRPATPTSATLFAEAARHRIRAPVRAAGRAARSLTTPAQTVGRVLRTAEAFTGLAAGGPTCPRSPLNVRVGRYRRIAWAKTSLAKLKRARGKDGATVNDVILAVAAGALRRFLAGRGEEVPNYLVALVPVSLRRPGDEDELGNRISTILVKLPIGEKDPAKRLELIHEETERLKESETARAASLIINATGWAPPTINRLLSQAMSRPLVFNLVVSNVPGPQVPLYLLGRRLKEIYPYVPLSPQMHALSIGVLSYNRNVFFGLAGDRDTVADLDELAAAIDGALAEQSGAEQRSMRKPAARKPAARKERAAKPTKPKRAAAKKPAPRRAAPKMPARTGSRKRTAKRRPPARRG